MCKNFMMLAFAYFCGVDTLSQLILGYSCEVVQYATGKRCSQLAFLSCLGQFQHAAKSTSHSCSIQVWRVVFIFTCIRMDSGLTLKYQHKYELAIKIISFIRRMCHTCIITMCIRLKNKGQGLNLML